uniref:non-specific serine/threonine protein kinase n=1 Tax=Populus alba TaxID=43335 RepID=A0A4U5P5B5_POPAL|nr:hypothetical protein D5086_0000227960 [Populus alba]
MGDLSSAHHHIFVCLCRLSRVPDMIKEIARVLRGGEDLPGFLRNHFVGLLNGIDRKILQAEDLSLQKQALRRIKMLIEMMGSQLGTYVPKLMVLLMHAIDKESLQNEGLSVLHFFIEQLANKSPSSTKHVISQVFAALIPFLERYKENPSTHLNKAVNILEELVLKNSAILKQHIHEFPLLPSISELMKVNKAIQEARGSMTLKDQLRDVVDGLNHENLNVRYMVVCELSKLLNLRRGDITSLITGEVAADMDILSSLITALLRGFQLPNVADSASVGPIYRPSMSFRRWIFYWIKKLTAHATGSRASIFNACRALVRHDMHLAIHMLPYLLLNAVCHQRNKHPNPRVKFQFLRQIRINSLYSVRFHNTRKHWCMQGVQAAWWLGRWDLMDEYISGADHDGLLCSGSESNASFDMDVAKILQSMMKKDQFSVAEKIALSKEALIAPLAAAGMDSYVRAYPFIVKLHLLRELEDFHTLLVDDSFLVKKIPFCLGAHVGICWLQYARLCRLARHYETANRAILESPGLGCTKCSHGKGQASVEY